MRIKLQNIEEKKKYSVKRTGSGLGLFADDHFKKSEFVIEYTGKILNEKEFEAAGYKKYFFEIDKYCTVDGSNHENIARYVNHACRPNCEVRIYAKRIRIYATRKIKPGEEFTYDYGEEYFNEYIKPKGCRCAKCTKS